MRIFLSPPAGGPKTGRAALELYKSRLHLTHNESSPGYAAKIFSCANDTLSRNVCIGVLP